MEIWKCDECGTILETEGSPVRRNHVPHILAMWEQLEAKGWSLWIGPNFNDTLRGWAGQLKRRAENAHYWIYGHSIEEVIRNAEAEILLL